MSLASNSEIPNTHTRKTSSSSSKKNSKKIDNHKIKCFRFLSSNRRQENSKAKFREQSNYDNNMSYTTIATSTTATTTTRNDHEINDPYRLTVFDETIYTKSSKKKKKRSIARFFYYIYWWNWKPFSARFW